MYYFKYSIWLMYIVFVVITLIVTHRNKNIYLFIIKIASILLFGLCCTALLIRNQVPSAVARRFIPPHMIFDKNNLLLAHTYTKYKVKLNIKKLFNSYEDFNNCALIPEIFKNKEDMVNKAVNNIITIKFRDFKLKKYFMKIPKHTYELKEKLVRKHVLDNLTTSLGYCSIHNGKIQGLELLALRDNVYSTIDLKLQILLANAINNSKLVGKMQWGIIMNLKGEIEALHHTDTPNLKNENFKMTRHPIFSRIYEFGSVCKIFTLWSALENNIINESSIIDNPHKIRVDNRIVANDVFLKERKVNIYTVMKYSLNTPIILLSRQLKKKLLTTLHTMHLFNSIDINGIVTPQGMLPKIIYDVDTTAISYGYAQVVSPIAILRAAAAIFNNGKIYEPTLIKGKTSLVTTIDPTVSKRVVNILRLANKDAMLGKLMCPYKTGTVFADKRTQKQNKKKRLKNTFIVVGVTDSNNRIIKVMLLGNIGTLQGSRRVKLLAEKIVKSINIKF